MKNLKKLAILLLGVFVLASMPSCNKDKMNGADKKISRIYYQDNVNNEKTLVEIWHWNNDDLLESIENFDEDGGMMFTIDFTYNDKDRISRVDCYYANLNLIYTYDDKLLSNLSLNYGSEMVGTCDITYKDQKMSKLTITVDEGNIDFMKKVPAMNPLSILFPRQISECLLSFEDRLAQRSGKQTYIINLQLTWDDDNISKVIGQGMGETITITAQYDTKNNPVYGFLLGQQSGSIVKNNITTVTVSEYYYGSESLSITYQYDEDDYPTVITAYPAEEPTDKEILYIDYQ